MNHQIPTPWSHARPLENEASPLRPRQRIEVILLLSLASWGVLLGLIAASGAF